MQRYKVLETVIHNGQTRQPGDILVLGIWEVQRYGKRVVKFEEGHPLIPEKQMLKTPNKMGRKGGLTK
jgi:hypothetical protein